MKARIVLAVLVLSALSSFAQTAFTGLQTTVTDSGGAAIPGAQVIVVNATSHLRVKLKTNLAGECVLPNLALGDYTVTVEKRGFSKEVRQVSIANLDAGLVHLSVKMRQKGAR